MFAFHYLSQSLTLEDQVNRVFPPITIKVFLAMYLLLLMY